MVLFVSGVAEGLQRLINLVSACCALMCMVISITATKVLVFSAANPGPVQWVCVLPALGGCARMQIPWSGVSCRTWSGSHIPSPQADNVCSLGSPKALAWAAAVLFFSGSPVQTIQQCNIFAASNGVEVWGARELSEDFWLEEM